MKKILLVEDTELLLQIERSILKRESFDLHMARSAEDALEKARQLRPDLIMLSMVMPDMRGEELCSIIKSDPGLRYIKIVICTSDRRESSLEACVDSGCDGIVTKPFRRDELFETVHKLLGETFRRKPRFCVDIPCAVYIGSKGIPAMISDISEIGCRIEMEEPPDGGTKLDIGFDLPETSQAVRWSGDVRWSFRTKNGPGGAGVEFCGVLPGELEALKDILAAMPDDSRL